MPQPYPQRIATHQLEEVSERYFKNRIPENWTCEKPHHDYGVDLKIDIFEGTNATGMELLVQLKSSQASNNQNHETITLNTSTYNYLWEKLQVVMLVKYIDEERKAYWLLLSSVPEPNQIHRSFSIRIPKGNTLKTIKWGKISDYIKAVKYNKLTARERYAFERCEI